MMNLPRLSLLGLSFIALSACATPTSTATETSQSETTDQDDMLTPAEFEQWKAGFIQRSLDKHYSQALLNKVIAPTELASGAIVRDRSQPEFTRPVWSYVETAASAARLNGGREALAETRAVFDEIEARYQIDREILTAIWGLESSYGRIQGGHDVTSALATLAAEGRRRDWAESQLWAILDVLQRGDVRQDQLKGSWAGAMGMTQFIPTTFRDYAVDFDGNNNIDIWNSRADALGSAAHYLSRFGWQGSAPIIAEVSVPEGFDYNLSDDRSLSVAEWAALGVTVTSTHAIEKDRPAKLVVLAGHKGPKFLTFKNFDVIKRYNNSTSYALGITVLAEALNGKAAIRTPWPEDSQPLSRTDKQTLQTVLTEKGYDTGGVDGLIGPNSRRAIRAWQTDQGLPADGYVDQALFARLTGS